MEHQKLSTWWIISRTLLPSFGSVLGSLVLALSIIGFHLLLLGDQANLFLPHVAGRNDDQLAKIYESTILVPLNNMFGNDLLGVILTALVWGFVGWLVYALLDLLISTMKEWRSSDTEIYVPHKGQVVRHPMHRLVVIRVLWRFMLGILAVASLVLLQPVISDLFSRDVAFLGSTSAFEMLKHLGLALISWLAIFHFYVVIFRLFVFRTRVFGEIIY